jgi:hypothetical protein
MAIALGETAALSGLSLPSYEHRRQDITAMTGDLHPALGRGHTHPAGGQFLPLNPAIEVHFPTRRLRPGAPSPGLEMQLAHPVSLRFLTAIRPSA